VLCFLSILEIEKQIFMITIISGTNRFNSNSIFIAEYYQALLKKKGAECRILDLSKLPEKFLFTALYENAGKDPDFNELKEMINNSDKFVFIVPEYNGSFPGVLKAFIDGLDFPGSFNNKKCALVGISSGVLAGALALSHLTDILNYLGMHVLAIKPRLPRIESLIKNGALNDKFLTDLLDAQAEAIIKF
jgi:chromate reductase, NAD(P)H dehydrogenase (quinone)